MTKKDYCLIASAIAETKAAIEAEPINGSVDIVGQVEQVRAVRRIARTLGLALKADYSGSYAFNLSKFEKACGFDT